MSPEPPWSHPAPPWAPRDSRSRDKAALGTSEEPNSKPGLETALEEEEALESKE